MIFMNETAEELADLQYLLERSAGDRARHLTDIVGPDRRLTAAQLSADLQGVLVLNVATVTRSGEPRLSAVDGHFLHGRWYFSTATAAVKARHLAVRPGVSVAYTPRDGYGVWTHGKATALSGDEHDRMDRYLSALYGMPLAAMADGIVIFRVEPEWMIGYAMTATERSSLEPILADRDRRLNQALDELG